MDTTVHSFGEVAVVLKIFSFCITFFVCLFVSLNEEEEQEKELHLLTIFLYNVFTRCGHKKITSTIFLKDTTSYIYEGDSLGKRRGGGVATILYSLRINKMLVCLMKGTPCPCSENTT